MQSNYQSPKGNAQPLTDDQIRRYAPSVFAIDRDADTSARYRFISSFDIVRAMRDQGFLPVRVQQSRSSDEYRRGHAKHIVTFRQATDIERSTQTMSLGGFRHVIGSADQTFNEIVLYNSHDGSSSYQLHAGKFRLICCNGLVVADSMLASIRIPHIGEVLDRVVEGAFHVMRQLPMVDQVIDAWRALPLPAPEQQALADAAMDLRWDKAERPGNIGPQDILRPRRRQDAGGDLWSTYNRIQEALLMGGTHYRTAKGQNNTTREVGSVQENVRLNKSLWKLTAHMAELHGVAMPESGVGDVIEGEVVA